MFLARPTAIRVPHKPPLGVAIVVSGIGVFFVAAVRLHWIVDRTLPIGWSVPLCLFIWFRRPWLLYFAVAAYIATFYAETYLIPNVKYDGYASPKDAQLIDLILAVINILVLAGIVHFTITVIDEAERRSKLLARLIGELTAVWRTAPVGLILANADLTDIRFNAHAAGVLGAPADENLASDILANRYFMWRDGEPVTLDQAPIIRAARGNVFVEAMECEIAGPSGRRVTVLLAASPVRQVDVVAAGGVHPSKQVGQSRAEGAVAAFVDISAAKTLQRELDLRRREAEEDAVRKTRFLSAVSHDIRTPANAISLLAELLGHAATNPGMTAEIPGFARDLRSSSQKLVELVSDVLDFTKLDAGRADLVETNFSLNDLINDECNQAAVLATQKGVAVRSVVPDDAILLRSDRVKIGRILGNLLSNAVKFTAVGEIIVSVEATRLGDLFVYVKDTGAGIPPDQLTRIFDEFYQVRSNSLSTDPSRSGTGLGLAICRRLSAALGMRLEVESTVGAGTTFSLHIPANLVLTRVTDITPS